MLRQDPRARSSFGPRRVSPLSPSPPRPRIEPATHALGADPIDLVLCTLSYDLLMGLYGCSTMVLATEDCPVAARNMDWSPTDLIARGEDCVVSTRAHGLGATPGDLRRPAPGVVTGLSHRGFCTCVLNAVGCDRLDPAGCPVLLFLRDLLDQAESFDDAVRMAESTSLMSSALTHPGRHDQ